MVWIFLEINTLSICFLISKDLINRKIKILGVFYYYSIQIFSSLLILFSVIKINFLYRGHFILMFRSFIKMGLWPFHSWYLKLITILNIKFFSLWVIITWQKILPFFLLFFSNLKNIGVLLLTFGLINLLLSLTYLKRFFNLKSVLGFSSININRWLIILIHYSLNVWKLFLLIYSLSLIALMFCIKHKIKFNISFRFLFFLFLLVLNIRGFPPTLMFGAKILALKYILLSGIQIEVVFIWILAACYIIFFYLFVFLLELLSLSFKN